MTKLNKTSPLVSRRLFRHVRASQFRKFQLRAFCKFQLRPSAVRKSEVIACLCSDSRSTKKFHEIR